jgi:hypothetical protein
VLGKLALWDALVEIASSDARLTGVDFHALAVRAKARHARVEKQRLVLAHIALRTGPPDVVNPVGPRHGSA